MYGEAGLSMMMKNMRLHEFEDLRSRMVRR